jgi:alpha-D-ribose 1-methylphosphonate 5-triphosphate synthase subunit PhnH
VAATPSTPLPSPAVTAADPALATQAVFRALIKASARPGTVRPIVPAAAAPAPLTGAVAAIALCLLDYETPYWLDAPLAQAPEVTQWLKFHTGAPVTTEPSRAAYALVAEPGQLIGFEEFALGSIEYPDRATTLVLQVDRFEAGETLTLSGPGIQGTRQFSAAPLPADFRARLVANRELFPRGVDLVLATNDAVAVLPRSVRIARGEK